MLAAGEGNVEAMRALIAAGANVTAKSKSGFTPLLFAVRNAQLDALRLLLDHGANANDFAADGTSALNVAIVNAFYEVASVLLDHGADPNLPDARASPLHTIAWLRKPGATDRAAGVGELATSAPRPLGKVTSLELAQAAARSRRQSRTCASTGRRSSSRRSAARRAIRRGSLLGRHC